MQLLLLLLLVLLDTGNPVQRHPPCISPAVACSVTMAPKKHSIDRHQRQCRVLQLQTLDFCLPATATTAVAASTATYTATAVAVAGAAAAAAAGWAAVFTAISAVGWTHSVAAAGTGGGDAAAAIVAAVAAGGS